MELMLILMLIFMNNNLHKNKGFKGKEFLNIWRPVYMHLISSPYAQ